MKKLTLLALLTISTSAFATVDGNHNLFVMVQDINSQEYYVQKAPIIGCWGLAKGPELMQLTAPYKVSNIGCGSQTVENINVLTCSNVLSAYESEDYSTFKEITLDISKCYGKDDADFIATVKKVVQMNFATKTVMNPKLILLK